MTSAILRKLLVAGAAVAALTAAACSKPAEKAAEAPAAAESVATSRRGASPAKTTGAGHTAGGADAGLPHLGISLRRQVVGRGLGSLEETHGEPP